MWWGTVDRGKRTPETEIDVVLTNLSALYGELHPDKPKDDFINVYFRDLYFDDSVNGDDLVRLNERNFKTNDEGIGGVPELSALIISCGFCVDALMALDKNELNLAWTFVVDARFWCGVPLSRKVLRINAMIKKEAIKKTRTSVASIKYEKYYGRQMAFIKNEYKKNNWRNKSAAARAITPLLEDFVLKASLPVECFDGEKKMDWYRWTYERLRDF
jgi:hypothetical protein